ncbi:hypothetical protein ACFLY7_02385 [Patescibacteria group bacterium]
MFKLTVAKIDEVLFQGKVDAVNCPGSEGELTIMTDHLPLITSLKKGGLKITIKEGEEKKIEIEKGLLEVGRKETIILV